MRLANLQDKATFEPPWMIGCKFLGCVHRQKSFRCMALERETYIDYGYAPHAQTSADGIDSPSSQAYWAGDKAV